MKKANIFLTVILSVVVVLASASSAFAQDSTENKIIIDANDFNTLSELENEVSINLNNPEVDEVDVYNIDKDSEVSSSSEGVAEYQTRAVAPIYTVKNVQKEPNYTGSSIIATAEGVPGVTVSISTTKGVSTTYSASLGASTDKISSAVGWSITGGSSISISGSDKVPSTHNNKKVKTMSLNAHAIYSVKSYDVYRTVPGVTGAIFQGSGKTKKAHGCSFTKSYIYK